MYVRAIDEDIWLQHAWRNRVQSFLLLSVMAGFLALLGWLLWGSAGIWLLLIFGAVAVLFHPVISPRLVMRLYGATPILSQKRSLIGQILAELSRRADLPRIPQLYYIPSRVLNAFAVGTQDQAAIAVTDGLLRRLNQREITAVLAHEIGHIRSNDLWLMGLADLFSRMTTTLSFIGQLLFILNLPLLLFSLVSINWFVILLLIFAPSLSALAQLALSRTREFDADLNAVRLTSDPDGLAHALLKIDHQQGSLWERVFMPGKQIPDPSLLRTHPETNERVERLMSLKPEIQFPSIHSIFPTRVEDVFFSQLGQPIDRIPRWHISGLWH